MPTVVVSTVRKYRFNTYLFPTVDCVIEVYAKNGRPAKYVELLRCLEEEHGIRGKRSLDGGLDAGIKNDYIKAVPMGGRSGYEPTTNGVVDTALYLALKEKLNDAIDNLSPDLLAHLLECLRISLVTILIPKIIQSIPDYIRAIKDPQYAIHLIKVQGFVKFLLGTDDVQDEEVDRDKALDFVRNLVLVSYVALKMLAGVEVKHLKSKYYDDVEEFIKTSTITNLVPTLANPRFVLIQLLLIACRNSIAKIPAIMR